MWCPWLIKGVTLDPEENIASFDLASLFTSILITEASSKKTTLSGQCTGDQNQPHPDYICSLLDLCLCTTYFLFPPLLQTETLMRHGLPCISHSCQPVLYMEGVERKALASFHGATPSHWFRYVDDTWELVVKANFLVGLHNYLIPVALYKKFGGASQTMGQCLQVGCRCTASVSITEITF